METMGRRMVEVPRERWPWISTIEVVPLRVWQSADYLAVLYMQKADGNTRLTVNSVRRKAERKRTGGTDWRDGITWDELQRIKNETVGPNVWCVEVYPAQDKLVDVSNMRHLWVLREPPVTRFPERSVVDSVDIRMALGCISDALEGIMSRA